MIPWFDLLMATQITQGVTEGDDDELSNFISYVIWTIGVSDSDSFNGGPITRNRTLANTDKPLMLTNGGGTNVSVNQGTPLSLHKLTDDSDYTVTTGKTAKLFLILKSSSVSCQFKIWESSTTNTASGIAKYTYAGNQFNAGRLITVCPEWDLTEKTFAAGKYITIEVTSSGDSVTVEQAMVIESDP